MKLKNIKKHFNSINVLSVIYSLLLVFGTSYFITGSARYVFKIFYLTVPLLVIMFILIRKGIRFLYDYLDNKKYNKEIKIKKSKLNNFLSKFKATLEKHPFLFSLGFILLLWLPYIISFYPAILSPDPSFQIRQYFEIPNKYSDYAIMLDESVTITNHHPVLHTLLLGTSLKIGNMMGNDNLGLFIYSIIQITILSCVLAYTIKYMTKEGVPYKFRVAALLIYALVPMFPLYAMSAVKDVIYSAFIILYTLLMFHLVRSKEKLKIREMIAIIILLILIILFRNNGFYVLFLSFPFLFVNKKNFKKLLIIFIAFVTFNYTYNDVILPYFKVTPSSIREMLSIPFQQTARYVKVGNKLDDKEYEIYDKILDMSDLAERYDPDLSDPVKNRYNKYTTDEELKTYFNYWFKGLLKDPLTYVEATVNNVYGYFYPVSVNWYVYYNFDDRIVENGFDYHYNSLDVPRSILSTIGKYFVYIPILGLISTIGFNTWLIFFMIGNLIHRKNYKGIIYLTPALVTLLVCMASPANAYFRYAMPYIFAMPMIVGLFMKEVDYEKR